LANVSATSTDAYVKLLSAQEVSRDAIASELEKIVRSLAWSASLWQGLSFELYWAKRGGGSKMRQTNTDFLKRFHLDVWEQIASSTLTSEASKE
jgi:hypothetical protein